jgi:hypothetical protein
MLFSSKKRNTQASVPLFFVAVCTEHCSLPAAQGKKKVLVDQ